MWLKLLLLTFYLLFLFVLSRFLEAASWYQDTETFLTSFAALDPITLSVKKLKQILDGRGISYSGVVEKPELIELVGESGKPSGEELVDDASVSKVSAETTQFTCGSHFYEEVEDTKDSAWLVQVVMNDEDVPLLPRNVWSEVVSKVSQFGIRTGRFKCSLDKRLCHRKGWTSPRLILALPRGNKAKEDVVLHNFLQPSTAQSILQWVRSHLASRVKNLNSTEELKKWMESSDGGQDTKIKIILFSLLKSCPMFLSSLAIKFNGRVKFAVADITKDNYRKTLNGTQFPAYVVISPERSFTYGSQKGECFNFKSMELFLKSFVPEMNDVFLWSLLVVNALASFELFFMYSQVWKHFLLYLVCVVKYNSVLFLLWLLILALNQFPFMTTCTTALLKCVRVISGSYIASVVRRDYKSFYSYTFLLASFAVFASAAGFILRKFKWVQDDVTILSSNWWFVPWDGFIATYFFRPMATLTRPAVPQDLDLEVGMELLIERLAVPNLWLQPVISMDYIKDLPVWKYQGWCEADDAYEESKGDSIFSSDDESANITMFKQVVNNIVPNIESSVDNLCAGDNSVSVCTNVSSPDKCKSSSDDEGNVLLNSKSVLSSVTLCSAKVKESEKSPIPDSERAPTGMLEFRECSICLESYRYGEFLCGLPCGHNFHVNCIMLWLTRDNHCCPVCRWPSYKMKYHGHHLHFQ